jgi:hypothetical protein
MASNINIAPKITLTTTGSSGPATLIGNTLNIPQYSGGGGGGASGIHTQLLPGGSLFGGVETSNAITFPQTATYTTQANQMAYFPYIPNNTFTATSLAFNVTNAIATSKAKLCIYSHDGFNGPQTKLYESTEIDLSTSGSKTISVSFAFTKGTVYWFGLYTNIFNSQITALGAGSGGGLSIGFVGTTSILAWAQVSITYPTAPTTAGVNTFVSQAPLIRIK